MSSQHPPTFLSRVFGVNSNVRDAETELSSIRDEYNSQDESRNRSLIESDQESISDNEFHHDDLFEGFRSDQPSDNKQHEDDIDRIEDPNHLDFINEAGTENDDDVPMSIMVQPESPSNEHHNKAAKGLNKLNNLKGQINKNIKIPSLRNLPSSTPFTLPLHNDTPEKNDVNTSYKKVNRDPSSSLAEDERVRRAKLGILNPRERALWKWANIENLDKFLQDVYLYYLGSGYYAILLSRALDLATLAFVVYFSTYLTNCIDYSRLKDSNVKSLADIRVNQCYASINPLAKLFLWFFYIYFILKVVQLYLDSQDLREVHQFYNYLLDISDKDLQTVSWQVVVRRIMLLKDQNAITSNVSDMKSKSRIDAHDIANRIMRKENYFIALYNKDILDLTLPIPGYRKNMLTRTLEWNLNLCISGFVFNETGQIRQQFLKESKRKELSDELSKRFMLAGVLNIILAPLIVAYFILLYFFRYFNEYRRNPGSIGSRQYTPFAEWKFREFNELFHIFQRRIHLSVPEASKYVDQFPKEKTVLVLKFVSFISGSFAAVLGILSVVDPDMFFNFEITKDKTVLFYISVFGTIWAICHGAIPEEYQVFDSEASLRHVASFTHYLPQRWEGKYHTDEVKNEFCEYFDLKAFILVRELSSLILTPFILWFSLPKSSNRIVDFFREFSVHVDGLGYVCTFAMFNFDKAKPTAKSVAKKNANDPRGPYYKSGEDKMMKSYLHFIDSYSNNETHRNGRPIQKINKMHPLHHSIHAGKMSQPQSPVQWHAHHEDFGSQSFMTTQADARGRGNFRDPRTAHHEPEHLALGESYITALPQTDANEADGENAQNPGVLGLLNQFYKDYEISRN